jgi:hypothetical protein
MLTVCAPPLVTCEHRRRPALRFISHFHTSDFKQAFETKYEAPCPDILLKTMDLYTGDIDKYYNRSFSIVQSSGMGKSRLVDHSATLRFTIPFNLHENMPAGSQSMHRPEVHSTSLTFSTSLPSFRSQCPRLFNCTVQGRRTSIDKTLCLFGGSVRSNG